MLQHALLSFCLLLSVVVAVADEAQNIHRLKSDLMVPSVTDDKPAAGRRFRVTLANDTNTKLAHIVYLPTDWKPDGKYPVLVEYPATVATKIDMATRVPDASKTAS